jgi:hypothetical protein
MVLNPVQILSIGGENYRRGQSLAQRTKPQESPDSDRLR